MRIFDYLFYKIYQFLKGFDDAPYFATVIVLFWLFQFNVFTIIGIILQNLKPEEIGKISTYFSTANVIIVAVLFLAFHFLYYYRRNRFLQIIEQYRNESRKKSIWGAIFSFIYVALTLGLFFIYTVPNIGGILSNKT